MSIVFVNAVLYINVNINSLIELKHRIKTVFNNIEEQITFCESLLNLNANLSKILS